MIMEIIVLSFLGLLAGIGLEIASKRFKEEKDERTSAVGDILPGLNCGACGYAGCDQYSEEVVKDPSKLGSCVQLSGEEREKMSEILQIDEEKPEK